MFAKILGSMGHIEITVFTEFEVHTVERLLDYHIFALYCYCFGHQVIYQSHNHE